MCPSSRGADVEQRPELIRARTLVNLGDGRCQRGLDLEVTPRECFSAILASSNLVDLEDLIAVMVDHLDGDLS